MFLSFLQIVLQIHVGLKDFFSRLFFCKINSFIVCTLPIFFSLIKLCQSTLHIFCNWYNMNYIPISGYLYFRIFTTFMVVSIQSISKNSYLSLFVIQNIALYNPYLELCNKMYYLKRRPHSRTQCYFAEE